MTNLRDQLPAFSEALPKAIRALPAPVRNRAANALDGFAKAKKLLPHDREMASFRAITAGEEAASALIRSLQMRDYPGSDLIDLKRHPHKAAVPFFLAAVRQQLGAHKPLEMTIQLSISPPKLTVSLPLRQFDHIPDDMSDLYLQLSDPLGTIGTTPGVDDSDYFDEAVQKVAGSRKVDRLIAKEANARNRILYAHDGGLPQSKATLESIEMRESQAVVCLLSAIAVLQVEHHQGFALQCLKGFLKIIGRTDELNERERHLVEAGDIPPAGAVTLQDMLGDQTTPTR